MRVTDTDEKPGKHKILSVTIQCLDRRKDGTWHVRYSHTINYQQEDTPE